MSSSLNSKSFNSKADREQEGGESIPFSLQYTRASKDVLLLCASAKAREVFVNVATLLACVVFAEDPGRPTTTQASSVATFTSFPKRCGEYTPGIMYERKTSMLWQRLSAPWQAAIEEAWTAYCHGSLPHGAV